MPRELSEVFHSMESTGFIGYSPSRTSHYNRSLTTYFESIISDDAKPIPQQAWPYKPCYHTVQHATYYPFRDRRLYGAFSSPIIDRYIEGPRYGGRDFLKEARESHAITSGVQQHPQNKDWDSLIARRTGSKRSKTNLINLALELDDISSLVRSFSATVKAIGKRDLRKLGALTPENILAVDFGLLPLLDELQASYKQLSTLQRRFERYMHRNAKWLRFAYGTIYEYTATELDPAAKYDWLMEHVYTVHCHEVMSGRVKPTNNWDETETYLRAAADAFGLYPDLGTVWNAIPFSFVIDWFAPVGDTLEQINPLAYNSRQGGSWLSPQSVETAHCGQSRKFTAKSYHSILRDEGKWDQNNLLESELPQKALICVGDHSIFERYPVIPDLDGIRPRFMVTSPFDSGRSARDAIALTAVLGRPSNKKDMAKRSRLRRRIG